MTDLYDIRVLALDVPRRYVQLRAIVVYYDTDPPYADPPDDPSFFFRLLTDTARQGTPLGDLITREEVKNAHAEAAIGADPRHDLEMSPEY